MAAGLAGRPAGSPLRRYRGKVPFDPVEALAIVFVAAVSAIIFVATWWSVKSNAAVNPLGKRDHLEAYRATLIQKAQRARTDGWDDAMVARINQELAEVEGRLARLDH